MTASGSSAFTYARIQKNSRLEASRITLTSQNRLRVGGGATLTAESIEVSGQGCSIASTASFNASDTRGTCLSSDLNRYPIGVSIKADTVLGSAPLVVNFSARARDVDGFIVGHEWDFGDGTSLVGSTATHTYENEGKYLVTLVVRDQLNAKVPAQVSIQVGGNFPPTANAGDDARGELGKRIALSGMSSSDPEGDELSYAWELSSKPASSMAILANPATESPFFVPDVVGDYTFSLVVNDEEHRSSADTVVITAFDPPNMAPTLTAIGNKTVVLGSELKFTIAGSDGDNDGISFSAMPSPLLANARFNGGTGEFVFRPERSQVGTHELKFFVSDGKAEDSEAVTITVTAPVAQVTSLTGRVLDTNAMTGSEEEIPIVAATVSILVNDLSVATGTTNAQGNFTLNSIPNAASYVLKIDSSTATAGPGGVTYADFIEPLEIIEGTRNVVSRPFFYLE